MNLERYNLKGIEFYKYKNDKTGCFHKVMYYNPDKSDICERLIKDENLTSLCFSYRFIKNDEIVKINFPFNNEITSISIDLELKNLSFLEQFRNLKELFIKDPNKPNLNLATFKQLKILSCSWSANLNGLEDIDTLEEISLWNFGKEDLRVLDKNVSLRRIELVNPKIKSMKGIENLPNLEHIDIEKGKKLEEVESFTTHHKKMKILRIYGSPNLLKCNSIQHLTNLDVITFGKVKNLESVNFLNDLKMLSICGIHPSNIKVTDNSIELLKSIRSKLSSQY